MAAAKAHPVGLLLGKVGTGKTTIFNKVCDAHRQAEITDDSCTRQYVSRKIFYGDQAIQLYDGPGCDSKEDTYTHSFVLRQGLTREPLSCVYVAVEYNPRIRNNMGGAFYDVVKILKPDYYDLVVLLVTKMDQFNPEGKFNSRSDMENHIRDTFLKDYHVDRVIFSCRNSTALNLFRDMCKMAGKKKVQLSYTDEEFMQYFDMKSWKGREQFDLHRLKKQVENLCFEFEEGLQHLVQGQSQFKHDEFQDYVYALIQQNRVELDEKVYTPFLQRNGEDEVMFDDYAASIELQKIISDAHERFRNDAKKYLAVNPDDHLNRRNAFRQCQYCREVWVKVEGCDDATTCGARPSSRHDVLSNEDHYFRRVLERVDGFLRPGKFLMKRRLSTAQSNVPQDKTHSEKPIGCGQSIVWKNQAVVSQADLERLFNTKDLDTILSSFTMASRFRRLKRKKEKNIQPFGELDEQGRDVAMGSGAGHGSDSDDNEESPTGTMG